MKKFLVIFLFLFSQNHALSLPNLLTHILGKKQTEQITPKKISPKVAILDLDNNPNFKELAFNFISVAKNSDIAGIILIIDNFGGAAGNYSVLHDLIRKIKTIKPVVALIQGGAASGGYFVACAADHIIASSVSAIGSIGVVLTIEKYKNVKIKSSSFEADATIQIIDAGEFKTTTNPYTNPLTEQDIVRLKENALKSYHTFLQKVAENRNLDLANYKDWAEGQIFETPEAIIKHLVDLEGTFFEAEQKIIELISKRNPDSIFAEEITPIFYNKKENAQNK